MSEYRRFVAYIYEYTNGKKSKNTGFAKVESRNGTCRMQICLQKLPREESALNVYGFVREGGWLLGILLGQLSRQGTGAGARLQTPAQNIGGSGYALSQLAGLWLAGSRGEKYLTVFDDEAIDTEKLVTELPETDKEREKTEGLDEGSAQEMRRALTEETEPGEQADGSGKGTVHTEAAGEESIHGDEVRKGERSTEGQKMAEAEEPAGTPGEKKGSICSEAVRTEGAEEPKGTPGEKKGSICSEAVRAEGAEEPKGTPGKKKENAYAGAVKAENAEKSAEMQEEKKGNTCAGVVGATSAGEAKGKQGEEKENVSAEAVGTENAKKSAGMPGEKRGNICAETEESPEMQEESVCAGAVKAGNEKNAEERYGETQAEIRRRHPEEVNAEQSPQRLRAQEAAACPTSGFQCRNRRFQPMNLEQKWQVLSSRCPHFRPFDDGEMADCIQITPRELNYIQQGNGRNGNNSFLMHGFCNYRHLLFGKRRDGGYILGIPGIFENQELFMANMFGFPEFREASSRHPRGRFGYWCRKL